MYGASVAIEGPTIEVSCKVANRDVLVAINSALRATPKRTQHGKQCGYAEGVRKNGLRSRGPETAE